MGFSYGQDNRPRTLGRGEHRPSWRASDAVTPVRETQPAPKKNRAKSRGHQGGREQRPYHTRPLAAVPDSVLDGLTQAELLTLRDKVGVRLDGIAFTRSRVPQVVRSIMKRVCEEDGIELSDMLSERRSFQFVRPRQRAMALVARLRRPDGSKRFGITQVGRFFGRDHSTVAYAIAKVEQEGLIDCMVVEDQ